MAVRAIRMDFRDNVAVATAEVKADDVVEIADGSKVRAIEAIPRGGKVALAAIAAGEPVIKVSSTSELDQSMSDDIDIDAGTVLAGKTVAEVGEEILSLLLRVARGERTKAEINDQGVFAIAQTHQAF
jgi:altronate dehydratase